MIVSGSARGKAAIASAAMFALAPPIHGQPGVTPGPREIVSLDFANTPLGEFPPAFKLLSGNLEAVDKDGVRMLKASAVTEFLITLPEVLPQDFTLEFDLIPKACCNPDDLMVEGTATMNRGVGSAQVVWDADGLQVVGGGGPMYQAPMPAELRAALPSALTHIVLTAEGGTLKLYTNGQRVFTLSDRQFVRGRVLRVFLGGQDDDKHAVYLARLSIAAGAQGPVGVATQTSGLRGPEIPGPSGSVRGVGSGSEPAALASGVSVAPRASAGAAGSGPIVPPPPPPPPATSVLERQSPGTTASPPASGTSAGSRMAAPNARLFAPPPPRTIALAGFTATGGFGIVASRTVTLASFSATGGFGIVASRTVTLAGFSAVGGFGSLAPRTITLVGFTGTGPGSVVGTRSPAISGLPGSGASSAVAPRTIALAGFTATGGFTVPASRTITLAGFTGSSGSQFLASRTIALVGFTATGGFAAMAPRTIKVAGWTAAGSEQSP